MAPLATSRASQSSTNLFGYKLSAPANQTIHKFTYLTGTAVLSLIMRLFVQREKELNAENAEKIKGLATKAQSHEEINNKKNLGVLVPLWQKKLKNLGGLCGLGGKKNGVQIGKV